MLIELLPGLEDSLNLFERVEFQTQGLNVVLKVIGNHCCSTRKARSSDGLSSVWAAILTNGNLVEWKSHAEARIDLESLYDKCTTECRIWVLLRLLYDKCTTENKQLTDSKGSGIN